MSYRNNIEDEFWGYSNSILRQGVQLQRQPKPTKANKMKKLVKYMDRCYTGK